MKKFPYCFTFLAIICSILFFPGLSHTQKQEGPDNRTLSPYFFVKSDDPSIDRLPLKSTSAVADVSGVIAEVKVTQVYRNEGRKPLEAIYVFPASTRAAVHGMKMTIGKRVIEAKIKKREEARKDYEEARQQGKSASLLEQQRPNVFQMNVANIMPGDEIKVELRYTELLVPTGRVYEFVYPAVVGPRYVGKGTEGASLPDGWAQNPYLRQGESPTYSFDVTVNISAGMPVQGLVSPSHRVNAVFSGPDAAQVRLDTSDKNGGNRDYILRYRLAGERIRSGLLLFEGEKENFFLCMVQPPENTRTDQIPGREYIFVVDVSGSMYGFPLDISKKLLKDLIGNLRSTDTFNILLFSGGSTLMSERSLPASTENIDRALHVIDRQKGGGGTELLPALKRALGIPKQENYSRTVVVVTDGYVMVEEEVFDLIRKNLNDANMFSFGIGTSVNRHIIEGMARAGMGEPFVITRLEEAPGQAERFRSMIDSPVLTNIKVDLRGFSAYDVEPLSIPDVFADRPVIVFGKWKGRPKGTITVRGVSGGGPFKESIDVASVRPMKENAALRYLWARQRITLLSDYNRLRANDRRVREVTELGLAYNLLTAYTSFVAVDTRARNAGEKPFTVTQPLPLPEGVSDHAIGEMNKLAISPPYPAGMYGFRPDAPEGGLTEEPLRQDTKRKTTAIIVTESIKISGGLTRQALLDGMKKGLADIERCLASSGETGSYTVEVVINPDGTVRSVKTAPAKTKGEEQRRRCITGSIKGTIFSTTADGKPAKATFILTVRA